MIADAPTLLLLNRSCFTGCTICRSTEPPIPSMRLLLESLDNICSSGSLFYIGAEAFATPEILPTLLQACAERGLMPILVTRGLLGNEPDALLAELPALLAFLLKYGPYRLLLALDAPHYEQLGSERLGALLRATRETAGIPDLLYLTANGERLPLSLLDRDEVNELCTIHTRPGSSVLEFLTGPQSKFAYVDLTGGAISSRNCNHTLQSSANGSRASEPVGRREHFYDGTRRPASQSNENPYAMSFNALVFETTFFCNAKCRHCYTSCGPDSPRDGLTVEDVARVIDQAALLPNLRKHCHIGGGEATLFWDDMIAMLRHAQSRGFSNSLVTNGWWGQKPQKAIAKVAELEDAGVEHIQFSVDAMHQDFIRPAAIGNIIRAAKEAEIAVFLRVCTTRTHKAGAVLDRLPAEDQTGISIAMSKVTPLGRAKETIPLDEMWLEPGLPAGACHEVLNLTVTPSGEVFPCCAGSELCPSLLLGNVFQQSLQEMMGELRGNALVRALVHAGPASFAEAIRRSGLGYKLRDEYANYCHLCNDIFTDPELAAVVKQSVEEAWRQPASSRLSDVTRGLPLVGGTGGASTMGRRRG